MLELIVASLTGVGFLAVIGIILKWLVSSMGKHVDRMGKHVDNLEVAFNKQSERLINAVDHMKDSLDAHILEEDRAHSGIANRLDAGDKFNHILLGRVTSIEKKLNQQNGTSHGGNGVS